MEGTEDLAGMMSGHPRHPASQAEWEVAAAGLLESGQVFHAQDLAGQGLERFPDSARLRRVRAVALLRSGAAEEARRVLQPLLAQAATDDGPLRAGWQALAGLVQAASHGSAPDGAALERLADLALALDRLRGHGHRRSLDPETLELLGTVYKECWQQSADPAELRQSRDLLREAFERSNSLTAGVSAACSCWLLGEREAAIGLARRVADHCGADDIADDRRDTVRAMALGIANLLLGEHEAALVAFHRAVDLSGRHYGPMVATLAEVKRLVCAGLSVPPLLFDVLKPPRVVVFTGHMIDAPEQEQTRFPPWLEPVLRAEIERRLDLMDAQVGYSMCACGAELLFVEAMIERGAEVHIVLPFDLEDYVATCVAFAGERWERRFRRALKLANTVTFATEDHYLGHAELFRFANQMLHGLATLRAEFLLTAPDLMAVWDLREGSLVGGAADFIDQWADITRLQIVDLDTLLEFAEPPAELPPPPRVAHRPPVLLRPERERSTRSMMFADLVGYSKLKDESLPEFLDFLDRLEGWLRDGGYAPELINTWGDAIVCVLPRAVDMAGFALRLADGVRALGGRAQGLPTDLDVRISLHAGPVYHNHDPFLGRTNFYGGHINRAARLEPVTTPGHVYATQQFVALLTAERTVLRHEAESRDQAFDWPYVCEYVGVLQLAKKFGDQPVYHLRRA
ncbi:MAG TPA: tetratricopeptide repeat-containing protein [Azospirillaceae bacterium]|nr:tetratricopeptide repeat-containing protein [Azospirillaceae bacterium]